MEPNKLLEQDSVVLITGGAKGITAQCAISLAKLVPCKFILVGRTKAQIPEPEWAAGCQSSEELQRNAYEFFINKGEKPSPKELQNQAAEVKSMREVNTTLQAIRSLGGQVRYCSADITDGVSFTQEIHLAVKEFGEISGVIHGAGNLADKLIENKSGLDYDQVVSPKVKGLESILQVINSETIRFLVLFSSVAGFWGNSGQADYAIANEVLNKSAHILRKALPNCHVVSINWGPWDSGMVSPQLKKNFEKLNIPLINAKEGTQILIRELTEDHPYYPQIVVGSPIFPQNVTRINTDHILNIRRKIQKENNPFVNDHCIGQKAVLPATCASAWLADTCEASYPGWKFFRMDDFKVFKGITFGEDAQEYTLELKAEGNHQDNETLIHAVVTSQNKNGQKMFHFSGKVYLTEKVLSAPKHPEIKDFINNNRESQNGKILYADGTLFHGPAFQGIQEVAVLDEHTVVTHVSLPFLAFEKQGQFPVRCTNPFINDSVVQSVLLWSQEYHQAPCLPSRFQEWVQYQLVPFDKSIWTLLNIRFHNDFAIVGDIFAVDDDGNEYFHITGLEATISEQLNRFIGKHEK